MDQKGQEVLADMPANRDLPQSFYIFFFLFHGFSPCGCKLVALCAMLPILLLYSYMTCTRKWFRTSPMKSQGILPSGFNGVWGFHFSFDFSVVPFSQNFFMFIVKPCEFNFMFFYMFLFPLFYQLACLPASHFQIRILSIYAIILY